MPIANIVAVAVTVAKKRKESLQKGLDKKKKRKAIKDKRKVKTNKKSIRNVNYETCINDLVSNDIK